jgi:hypothetical protein
MEILETIFDHKRLRIEKTKMMSKNVYQTTMIPNHYISHFEVECNLWIQSTILLVIEKGDTNLGNS